PARATTDLLAGRRSRSMVRQRRLVRDAVVRRGARGDPRAAPRMAIRDSFLDRRLRVAGLVRAELLLRSPPRAVVCVPPASLGVRISAAVCGPRGHGPV